MSLSLALTITMIRSSAQITTRWPSTCSHPSEIHARPRLSRFTAQEPRMELKRHLIKS